MEYFERVKPTYIENWPSSLCRLSFGQVDIQLTLEEARAVGFHIIELGEGFAPKSAEYKEQLKKAYEFTTKRMMSFLNKETDDKPQPVTLPELIIDPVWLEKQKELFAGVKERVSKALSKFQNGAVIRLGSRSPKDSFGWCNNGPRMVAGDDPLRYIIDCSERMSDDLMLALDNNYQPHIFVREWIEIPEWTEFRCFMANRQLIGMSQYNYNSIYKEIDDNADTIIFWFKEYLRNYFLPACTLDDVVFDVAVSIKRTVRESGLTESQVSFKLIEINPFFEMTDPCLFDWRGDTDFDGTFRYRTGAKTDQKIQSMKI